MNEPTYTKLDKKVIYLTERFMFKMALFSVAMMTVLGSIVISPALPSIAKNFEDVPQVELLTGLVLTIPALFVMIFSPIAGILMDKFGKLKFLYPAIVIWIVAGVAGSVCTSIYAILLTRCIFGIATAFITTAASTLLGDYYAIGIGRRDRALSLQGFVLAMGGALLTMLSGYLTSFSWRYSFLVYAFGIFIFIFCLFYLFEPRRNKSKKAHIQENSTSIDYKIFLPVYFMGFFIVMIYYLAGVQFPHYIEDNLGLDPHYIGVAMAVPTLSYGIFCFLYKNIRKKISIKQIYIYGLLLEALGFLLVFVFENFFVAMLSLFIFGMVGGLIITNNSAYLFTLAPANMRARAYSGLASCIFFGQFISPIITTPMVHYFGLKTEFAIWVAVILLISLLFSFLKVKS